MARSLRRGAALCAALLLACEGSADAPATTALTPTASNVTPTTVPTGSTLPIEDVARYPRPGTSVPGAIRFSPDDKLVTFLRSPDDSLSRELYALDIASGKTSTVMGTEAGGDSEENLTLEEKLRRERMRQRATGVTRYAWSKEGETILVPMQRDLFVLDGPQAEPRRVVDGEQDAPIDARMTRDGSKIAFVMDDELYVVPTEGGTPRQITKGARGTGKTHGLAEYIAQEEMGRHHGYWWSNDGSKIAYTEVDETHIPIYRIIHQGKDTVGEGAQEDHRYPFAGKANARVKLGVISAKGGSTKWMDLSMEGVQPGEDGWPDLYLARVHWMPDGSLVAEIENRDQTRLDLVRFNPATGKGTRILREETDVWINLHGVFEPLEEGDDAGAFVWASERSGFRHLYVIGADGKVLRQLTDGDWMVDGVAGVDEKGGQIYFTGNREDPRERHLYRVPLAGGEIERITKAAGTHGVTLDHGFTRFIDTHQSLETPPRITIRDLKTGEEQAVIHEPNDPRVQALGLRPPELVEIQNRDGTRLYGALYLPSGPKKPRPTLVSVYGGPHAQRVTNGWNMTVDMRAQYLRGLGYAVFVLDNRGSARRGLAFEGAIKHDMGHLEVQDQQDGVKWLVDQGYTDPARVGIYGWSYGGYMSAMSLMRAPETFKVAIAGAPVTSWDGYDTHYTERYMGTPQGNPKGYESSDVMKYVDQLKGNLLLVHGGIDENVHFRHTARLVSRLIDANKNYDLLMFPDERHMPRKMETRVYMEERIRQFLEQHL